MEPGSSCHAYHIAYSVPRLSYVRVDITDSRGRPVRWLAGETTGAGRHHLVWDGKDEAGRLLTSGTYTCRLVAQTAGGHIFMQAREIVIQQRTTAPRAQCDAQNRALGLMGR